ncbi:NAD-dependent succinate-semialdehyde dehydrogenase [soil metagenome]
MDYQTVNPCTEELEALFPVHKNSHVETAIKSSVPAFKRWRAEPVAVRCDLLNRVADSLLKQAERYARLMAVEMGKPLPEGIAEINKCAAACRHYAENSAEYLHPDVVATDAKKSYVSFEPLGPIFAIMPWNFPFWQVIRFAAPTLALGNVVLLKHAPNTPQCALALEELFRDAGAPVGVFQSLFMNVEQSARAIEDFRVKGVTFTGSTRAGREIAAAAGRALKPCVMELGGSDPFIVLEDADLELAAETAVAARCLNSGQSCIAAKRFLIQKKVFLDFAEQFVRSMRSRVVGNPQDAGVQIGPLARRDLRDQLHLQVQRSIGMGAKAACGGKIPEGKGFFYPPTVLLNAPQNSPARRDEMFGPVATLIPFDKDEDAFTVANETQYGLGASVWTKDKDRAARFIVALDAGCVFVNGMVKSDARIPFGGAKNSGFGRELGREGMLEFANKKTVWIAG